MVKKLHFTFAVEGEDVDKIDVYEWLQSLAKKNKLKITSGSSSIYYTEDPIEDKKKSPST